MKLNADERARFLASLREDAEFREEVRREVLTPALLDLPASFASFVAEMHAFVEKMHAFVAEMHAFVEEMHAFVETTNRRLDAIDRDMGRLKDDSAKLRGEVLETKIRFNPGYYLRRHARKVKLLQLDELLEYLSIDISDAEYDTVGGADVLARGQGRQSGEPVVLVVETTWRVHRGDVERQVVRREILVKRGIPVIAAIVSVESPNEDLERYASLNGVFIEPDPRQSDPAWAGSR
ncbi:MAG: hypothetical protein ACRDX8_07980 [Acidimicrobiales bacterium]